MEWPHIGNLQWQMRITRFLSIKQNDILVLVGQKISILEQSRKQMEMVTKLVKTCKGKFAYIKYISL